VTSGRRALARPLSRLALRALLWGVAFAADAALRLRARRR
jgi:hypothetical protein